MKESDFATYVEDLLRLYRWRWVHYRPARTEKGWRTALTGHKGLLDYIAVRPPRLLVFEIKGDKGKVSSEEQEWIDDLIGCYTIDAFSTTKWGVPEVKVWYPKDFDELRRWLE